MNAPEQSNQATVPDEGAATAAHERERPEGPAAAALLAAGVGATVLGLLTTLAAASEGFQDWLALTDDVGPLSGKTIYAVGAWLVAWAIIHWLVRPELTRTVLIVTALLIGLGVLGTFPIFFEAFAPE